MSIPCGLTLWEAYQRRVLADTTPENRIITHYESYFIDPRAELERILAFLSIQLPQHLLSQAASTCKGHLRNNRCAEELSLTTGSRPIAELYDEMCAHAGPVYNKAKEAETRIA